MTTEYYQIPSQQGLLPLDSADSSDPWLAAATSSLSLSDWTVKGTNKVHTNPPSLFEPDDAESVAWKHVVPMTNAKVEVKAPKTPKQFNSTSSKIDAWSVVDSSVVTKQKKHTKTPSTSSNEEVKPEDEPTGQNRYKTELCKSFTETGNCRYGVKCQFAHGKEEIRPILRHPKYKTEICKTFHTTGTCPYGIRCRFIHTRSKEETLMVAVSPSASPSKIAKPHPSSEEELESDEDDDVDGASVNAPPGIPVPQWSKSWNMAMSPSVPSKSAHRLSDRLTQPEPAF